MRFAAAALALALAACGGLPRGASALNRIAQLEHGRDPAAAEDLLFYAAEGDAPVRARAALALGRMRQPSLVDPLLRLANDPEAPVRRAAIFALGIAAPWSAAGDVLKARLSDPDERVRAAAAEAIGRLAGLEAPRLVAPLFQDRSALVRAEAALACFRWSQMLRLREPRGSLPDLPHDIVEGLARLMRDPDSEVRWRAAYVFARIPDARPAAALVELLADPDPWARLFAVRALAAGRIHQAATAIVARARDPEHAVRLEAIQALKSLERPSLIPSDLARDPRVHVRAAYAAAVPDPSFFTDPSPTVHAQALLALAASQKAEARPHLERALAHRSWIVREAAAQAAVHLGAAAIGILDVARGDTSDHVRAAAVAAAARLEGRPFLEIVRAALSGEGLLERSAAVEGLSRLGSAAVPLAIRTYEASADRKWLDLRKQIVKLLSESASDEARDFLERLSAETPEPPAQEPHRSEALTDNVVVVLETNRGRIAIECFAEEAPVHAASFVELVRSGFYDGLTFHRVVPNFVIQGGDPTGTGTGDAGYALRAELNPARFDRATLGMPRAADLDSGGCQIFLTHIPTPHLDGLYTAFGRVVDGHSVVDAIERGDRIERAFVRD